MRGGEIGHLVIVTHTDLDGVGAAASAMRALGRTGEATILFAEPYNVHEVLRGEALEYVDKGDGLVVSDIGYNSGVYTELVRLVGELASRGVKVEWYDHHVWDDAAVEGLRRAGARVVVDRSTCATGVVARYIDGGSSYERDEYLRELERAVCSADLWRWDHPLSPKLFRVVGERRGGEDWKRRLAVKLAEGVMWDDEMEARLEEYVNLELRGYEAVMGTVVTRIVDGVKLAVAVKGRGPPSSSMIGSLLLSRFNADVAVIARLDGGISFRSSRVNVRDLAASLGGGGHPRASGAKVRLNPLVKLASRLHPKILSFYISWVVAKHIRKMGGLALEL